MRTSVITFDSRLRRRFAYLAAEAAMHARDDGEAAQVRRIAEAVDAGHLTLRDAHAALSDLRRAQQSRAA
jgi:hypothetical protein